jgi:hypothetical protein
MTARHRRNPDAPDPCEYTIRRVASEADRLVPGFDMPLSKTRDTCSGLAALDGWTQNGGAISRNLAILTVDLPPCAHACLLQISGTLVLGLIFFWPYLRDGRTIFFGDDGGFEPNNRYRLAKAKTYAVGNGA